MQTGLLRFITAGSVDDGKSTLIGRLLFDTKAVLTDQLAALGKTKYARVTSSDAAVDLALLTDGLEAEREQGITIDVAYRYFATAKRKFIVADAPGHEQYTRNLVTGASQADAAVILVDISRLDFESPKIQLLAQTIRHSAILKLLGIRHLIFAVNKMDLYEFSQAHFEKVSVAIHELVEQLHLPDVTIIPIAALLGDNVVDASSRTPWYQGPTLLSCLEQLELAPQLRNQKSDLRFPVQLVARQDGSSSEDYRGYLGRIEAGMIAVGQEIKIEPAGIVAKVKTIHLAHQNLNQSDDNLVQHAQSGQVVAIELDRDCDVSRGDMFVDANNQEVLITKQVLADICWLNREPLSLQRKYILRQTTNQVVAKIKSIDHVFDVSTVTNMQHQELIQMNDIGRIQIHMQKNIVADKFEDSLSTGAFILIDEVSNHTVAAGMIREGATHS
jgi:sulfate adenylyltransferase subunit 1